MISPYHLRILEIQLAYLLENRLRNIITCQELWPGGTNLRNSSRR